MAQDQGERLLIAASQHVAQKLRAILANADIEADVCTTGEEALSQAREEGLLLVTTWRLADMTGAELAQKLGEGSDVLMIVPQDFRGASGANVMTLSNPISQEAFVQAVRVLAHCRTRMGELRARAQKLSRTLEERKVIERAKGRLMDQLHLSESEAHYRMQKKSMDSGRRIIDIAREILDAEEIIAS
ncbi:MAG: ANTAR domain-containing protein [Clostridiales bacterium]|nr:ANTAR domain-containing protein [Clostridiales bacterium]